MRSYRFGACLLLLASAASDLYADGCFLWNKGADLNEPSQKAVILWRGGTEVMILQVKYEGPAEDFAWIIPLPAQPKLHAVEADKSPFAEISLYTQQRARWGLRGREEADREQKQGVTVLQRKVVGVYDIAVLAADDAGALSGWLNKNGYAFPKNRNDVLEHYTRKHWVYAAMRIDRKALHSDDIKKLKTGELQPVRFTFAARQMVYPLRISSVNAGETEVLLYLLADAPMVLDADRRPPDFAVEQNIPRFMDQWCTDPEYGTYRKVAGKELPLTWESLGLKKETALSLCKYRCLYKTEQMIDDLAFAPLKPLPYWETRLESEPYWRRKLAIVNLLMRHDKEKYTGVLRALLDQWSKSPHASLRRQVAKLPDASAEIYDRLVADEDLNVRYALAGNPHVPAEILFKLGQDPHRDVRYRLGGNPAAGEKLLRRLTADKDDRVIYAVVRHANIPEDLILALGRADSDNTRASVAASKRCPADLLRRLAGDEHDYVRTCVASNPNTPAEVLAVLAGGDQPGARQGVAANPSAPAEVLRRLASDPLEDVRQQVAGNAGAPADALQRLARDKSTSVCGQVARNPNTPTEALVRLVSGPSRYTSARAALNARGVSPPVLPKIPKEEIPRGLPAEVKRQIGQLFSSDPQHRAGAARTLGTMHKPALPAIPFLVALLDDYSGLTLPPESRSTTVAQEARTALWRLAVLLEPGDAAVQPLLAAISNWDYRVRSAALAALGMTKDPRAEKPLFDALDDPSPDVRRVAMAGLARRRNAAAVAPIMAALKDEQTSSAAVKALAEIGKPAVEPLLALLGGKDPELRRRASEALLEIQDPATVGPLIEALEDEDLDVRTNAARALGRIGDARAAGPLIAILQDPDRSCQYAIDALQELGAPAVAPLLAALKQDHDGIRDRMAMALGGIGKPAIGPLMAATQHPDYRVRHGALRALKQIEQVEQVDPHLPARLVRMAIEDQQQQVRRLAVGILQQKKYARAAELLLAGLKDERWTAVSRAARALQAIADPKAVGPVIAAVRGPLSTGEVTVRCEAAGILGATKDGRAVEPLLAALRDKHYRVRLAAARALQQIDDPRWVRPMIATLKADIGHEDSGVRFETARVLRAVKHPLAVEPWIAELHAENIMIRGFATRQLGELGDARALPALLPVLRADDPWIRQTAAESLGRIGDPRAIGSLAAALGDEQRRVSFQAARALEDIKDFATVTPLIAALEHEHQDVRVVAARALGKLKDPRAIPALRKASKDASRDVASEARHALEAIDGMPKM